jgi:hypothetical protein
LTFAGEQPQDLPHRKILARHEKELSPCLFSHIHHSPRIPLGPETGRMPTRARRTLMLGVVFLFAFVSTPLGSAQGRVDGMTLIEEHQEIERSQDSAVYRTIRTYTASDDQAVTTTNQFTLL